MVQILRNLSAKELIRRAIADGEAQLSKTGAIVVETGVYTGRSPEDRYIVKGRTSQKNIHWGKINQPISTAEFRNLNRKIQKYLDTLDQVYQTDGWACADRKDRIAVRVISEFAYQSLFSRHLLINGRPKELEKKNPDLTVIVVPDCKADPKTDGTRSEAFIVLNLEEKVVLIGGTKYAGEIKKSIFSYLNFLLPQKNVFPMHCSANTDNKGNSALFFGLSGTGKTTLSSDLERKLIGDDEHGWSDNGIYNFEGGCYAKCINLSQEKEPQIFDAIRDGALVENVVLDTKGELCFDDSSLTENTRVAYPLNHITNFLSSGRGKHPDSIIFLTADATGVLPAVASLDQNQAIYFFLSGYTSKLAGTERGVIQPKPTFSSCFGAPFMPLHPEVYSQLFRKRLSKYNPRVYLVNTGWFGGQYGVGQRISIGETRAIIRAILSKEIEKTEFFQEPIFKLTVPKRLRNVSPEVLDPMLGWGSKEEYLIAAENLKRLFIENARRYKNILPEQLG